LRLGAIAQQEQDKRLMPTLNPSVDIKHYGHSIQRHASAAVLALPVAATPQPAFL
jgi:hypothetical protein